MRASAYEAAITVGSANERTTAIAWIMPRVRWVNLIGFSFGFPGMGKRPKDGQRCLKEKPIKGTAAAALSRGAATSRQVASNGYDAVMVSFTAATSWASVKGFGRKANCWFSGRLFSKASSA